MNIQPSQVTTYVSRCGAILWKSRVEPVSVTRPISDKEMLRNATLRWMYIMYGWPHAPHKLTNNGGLISDLAIPSY